MPFNYGLLQNKHSWEDYPDGTNCTYKTGSITYTTGTIGFTLGTLDVIAITRPANIGGALAVYPKYMVPAIFSGMAFGMTTCALAQIRKKDDRFNYFCGGVAAGTVIGASKRSIAVGFPVSMLLGFAAVLYKHGRLANYTFFPEAEPVVHQSPYNYLPDWSLKPERPKYTGNN